MTSPALPALDPTTFDTLSLDVFDTLLLRDLRPERARFQAIASRGSAALRERLGADVPATAIHRVRLEVQALAYRTLELEQPHGDIRLADMAAVQARVLGLGTEGAAILEDAEIAEETETLRPHDRVVAWAAEWARRGKRVIAVSDTYLSEPRLRRLLDDLSAGGGLSAVYSSSEEGSTKRSSHLFGMVIAKEGTDPGRMVHCGDDLWADVRMAEKAGLRAHRLPRSRAFRVRHKLGAGLNRLAGDAWLR